MGIASSRLRLHPVYLPPETMGNLTIRNLSITPLELKHVERLTPPPPPGAAAAHSVLARLAGHETAPDSTPSQPLTPPQNGNTKDDVTWAAIPPFSETTTAVPAPDPLTPEQLRLTFEDAGTGHRYVAEVPGPSPQSVVMRHETSDPTGKEFTVVYLPRSSHLAVFSCARLEAWMAELDSSLPLSALSIPGTHNSPAYHAALPSVRCQVVNVRAQLDNGVRFLDVRVSCPAESLGTDDLALVHSAFPVALTGTRWFHDLLDRVYGFLDANPSETVLMSVKREGTGGGSDALLSRYLARRYFAGDAARRWYLDPRIPSLGEARGRVVLVRRFHLDDGLRGEHGSRGIGIDGSVWPDNCADGTCGSGQIRIQDFYDVKQSVQIPQKIDLARAELERAAQQVYPSNGRSSNGAAVTPTAAVDTSLPPLFINFLSASNFFVASCWPDKIAVKINPSIIEYLCTGHGNPGKGPGQLDVGDAGTGIVVIDWVGNNGDWDIVHCIVGWNARLQLKR